MWHGLLLLGPDFIFSVIYSLRFMFLNHFSFNLFSVLMFRVVSIVYLFLYIFNLILSFHKYLLHQSIFQIIIVPLFSIIEI